MNSVVRNQEKTKYVKNNSAQWKNQKAKKDKSALPPLAFLILDLTSKSSEARIIRITQLLVHSDGDTTYSEHLFNAGDQEISEEAAEYHKLTVEQLKDKPSADTFNFEQAQNIVVWDGQVSRKIFKYNNIKKYSSLINMQSLARYLRDIPHPIKMNDYALETLPERKNILEFKLQKPENKVIVMPEIFQHLKGLYKQRYDEDRISFLIAVSRAPNKDKALEAIAQYLKKRKEYEARAKNKPQEKPVEEAGKKKIIVAVKTTSSPADSGKTAKKYKPRTTVKSKKK